MCSPDAFLCISDGEGASNTAADCTNPTISPNPVIDYGNGLGIPTATDASALMAYYSGLAVSTASISSRTSMSGTATSSAGPASSTTASDNANSSSGLSSSAKIGLGVGVGVGVPLILLAVAILLVVLRRKKPSQRSGSAVSPTKSFPDSPVPEYRAVGQEKPSELSTVHSGMNELPAGKPTHELPSGRAAPSELENR